MDGNHKPTKQAISGPNAFRALGLIFLNLAFHRVISNLTNQSFS
jgi:hypothetical protein